MKRRRTRRIDQTDRGTFLVPTPRGNEEDSRTPLAGLLQAPDERRVSGGGQALLHGRDQSRAVALQQGRHVDPEAGEDAGTGDAPTVGSDGTARWEVEPVQFTLLDA